ncbi:MAG: hypothetical protein VW057_09410 [Rhodospirillaceae bacterium]
MALIKSYPVYSTGFPYTAVVYLEATFADGTLSGGTGVVVGQNDILTASHVVFNAGRGGAAVEVTAYPGRNGGSKPFGRFKAASIDYLDSDKFSDLLLTPQETASDIAILGFNEDIRSQTGASSSIPIATLAFTIKQVIRRFIPGYLEHGRSTMSAILGKTVMVPGGHWGLI